MKKILLVFLALLAGSASAASYAGYQVVEAPFPIVGGEIVTVGLTERGAVPVENDKIKIEAAGFTVQASKSTPGGATLTWIFALTSKTAQKVEQVSVEEVFTGETAVMYLQDKSPRLSKEGMWSMLAAPVDITPETPAWLYAGGKPSVFIFKFTVIIPGEPTQVLYQLSSFSTPTKELFVRKIQNIRASKVTPG